MTAELSTLLRRGLAAHEGNRLQEAEKIYRRVLDIAPNNREAEHLLATLLTRQGHHREALELFENCVSHMGANPAARCNYAIALEANGNIEHAIDEFRLALSYHGDFPTALFHLARLEKARGNYGQTIDLLGRMLNLHSGNFDAFLLFGEALNALGQYEAALMAFENAAEAAKLDADKINQVGAVLLRLGHLDAAQNLFSRALSIHADHVPSMVNMAASLIAAGKYQQANNVLEAARTHAPDMADIEGLFADILIRGGDTAHGVARLAALVEKNPARADFHARLLSALLYLPQFDGPEYLKQARQWARSHLPPQTSPPKFANTRSTDRRLRIGWISPDFRDHPLYARLMGLARNHDRNTVELFLYSAVTRHDDITRQWQIVADSWRDVAGQDAQRIAERIRKDKIDILVDLSGFTRDHPIEVFAHRPAPVQVTFYHASTGIGQIDHMFGHVDMTAAGAAENRICSETLHRLPHAAFAYTPPENSQATGPLPALLNGYLTFGFVGTLPRIGDTVLNSWARIMNKAANSRLIIQADGLHDAFVRQNFLDRARQAGIHIDRVTCQGITPDKIRNTAIYDQIDIGLDPFPANNITAGCDMLWHGVPFVTLAGTMPSARCGLGVLSDVGLDALAAETRNGYVQKAVLLGRDVDALSMIRRTLRDRVLKASMMNHRLIAADFEEAYRDIWRTWCTR